MHYECNIIWGNFGRADDLLIGGLRSPGELKFSNRFHKFKEFSFGMIGICYGLSIAESMKLKCQFQGFRVPQFLDS